MKTIIENKKISVWSVSVVLMSVLFAGAFMQGCSNDLSTDTLDSQAANLIAAEYLELQGDQYVLNISESTALGLGISEFDYSRMLAEINKTNAFILECKEANMAVDINDPQDQQIRHEISRLRTGRERTESQDSFSLLMPPTGAGASRTVHVPDGAKAVKISTTVPCLLGVVSYNINCGGTEIAGSVTGISGGQKTVNLPASNTNMTFQSNTPCSGGGSVTVSFVY